ncbi:MAG: hypothetical protein UHX00_13065, partial [Caryophanon sp.]|nr:hypothetical protein [Caryophanon sp.]
TTFERKGILLNMALASRLRKVSTKTEINYTEEKGMLEQFLFQHALPIDSVTFSVPSAQWHTTFLAIMIQFSSLPVLSTSSQ